jgi:O-acetyl-ADP-ribose deacetylase (regulator of RNase III)
MNVVLSEQILSPSHVFQLAQGDLTAEPLDAIVNAANSHLQHGGGVAGAIAHRGGPVIQEESIAWIAEHGPVSHAEPAFTSAGRLPCRYVIHAVGPVWGEGDEDAKLASAVAGALRLAERLGLKSLALPAISTGIFGFPRERAAGIIIDTVRDFFAQHPASGVELVRLTLLDSQTVEAFQRVWRDRNR